MPRMLINRVIMLTLTVFRHAALLQVRAPVERALTRSGALKESA